MTLKILIGLASWCVFTAAFLVIKYGVGTIIGTALKIEPISEEEFEAAYESWITREEAKWRTH